MPRQPSVHGAASSHDGVGQGHHVKDLAKADSSPCTAPFPQWLGNLSLNTGSQGQLTTSKAEF